MKMTLEEIVADAAMNGYDMKSILDQYGENRCEIRTILYGYALSEDKLAFLENLYSGGKVQCNKILYFEDELKDYLNEIKTTSHTKIISGFHVLKDVEYDNGSLYDASIFRILLIDDNSKKAFVKDIEYMDNVFSEQLCIWSADLDYAQAIQTISLQGEDELLEASKDMVGLFMLEGDIKLNEHLVGVFGRENIRGDLTWEWL